jgi:hypothetical protein
VIIVFEKETGGIRYTIDNKIATDTYKDSLDEELDVISTIVEHGRNILTMRVDTSTRTLVSKSAIMFDADKYETVAGEPVVVTFSYEGEQFGETFPLVVNRETVLDIPYETPAIELELTLPGEYTLLVPDLRVYCIPRKIIVKENMP